MKNIFRLFTEKNVITKTKGTNKRKKLFNLTVNVLTTFGFYKINMFTKGLFGLTMLIKHYRKNKKNKKRA